jgi:hypothetical protein
VGKALEVIGSDDMICASIGRISAAALLLCFTPAWDRAVAEPPLTYNKDIRPILSDNCFACHGPDARHRKAKLRLDVREDAVAKKAIVPAKPDESELVRRIFTSDADDHMPPGKSEKTLTTAQKEALRRWIEQGAQYQPHWAYIAPVKASIPEGSNGIDVLVGQRLKEVGLERSAEADRRTLARRLYFDLTGLPPKPEIVEAFERDTSPDAYEKLVETLLASPHFGERMAIPWLDVVRYADTIGYHSDNPRNVWPYRDYVIRAFNENKPFDQFTREQIAGDLFPHNTLEQKVGSAFNRLLLSTEEGGAQPKDYEARMLTDRVRAVAAVWLGQTLGCAQCHDHKFDPITSHDFYSMGAFFADINEPTIGRREDGMLVPDALQATEVRRLERELEQWQKEYELARPEQLDRWERRAVAAARLERSWVVLQPEETSTRGGHKLRVSADGVISAEKDPTGGKDTYRVEVQPTVNGILAFRIEALASDKLPAHGPGRSKDGGFALTQFGIEDAQGREVEIANVGATFQSGDDPVLSVVSASGPGNGWVVEGLEGVPQAMVFEVRQALDPQTDGPFTLVLAQDHGENAVLGRFRISATSDPETARAPAASALPGEIAEIVQLAPGSRSPEQQEKLSSYYRSVAPELAGLRRQLAVAQKARDDYEATVPHCLVSNSLDKPRAVRILPRGNWMVETGDIVEPALPAYLVKCSSGSTNGQRLTRLDLANWLVSRDNPLTARVVMNRFWKQFFGIGLSKVLDDLGAQGEAPRNPALLDWLACEFMDSGWDMKHMVGLMVTSRTYRQASTASKELQSRDPDNRELARQSRWRLDAELVRDDALAISGLLEAKIGGPSVKPYQPDGYWENLNFPVRTYEPSKGEDQYRRGLYTWWQRSYLHPSILAFDAPTREECAADRPRSNIPQQALVLLNDPTYVEAARAFAVRILDEGGTDPVARLTWAWRQAVDRAPRPDELQTAEQLFYKEFYLYKQNTAAADALLSVGQMPVPAGQDHAEVAAWTIVTRVLLNLHETITRS